MESGSGCTRDWPESCYDVFTVVSAEETTLVDAVSSGNLDRGDIETFLRYAADHDVDPGIVHLVSIIDSLLEEYDVRAGGETNVAHTR